MLKPLLGFHFGSFPIYQIMICIGCLAALIGLNQSLKRIPFSKFNKKRIRRSFFWGGVFGLAGANIANWFFFEHAFDYSLYHRITQGGFSFFYGLLCFIGVSALFLRLHKTNVGYCLSMIVPSILLLQFFARLGCSLRGCCWGDDITLFGLTFPLPLREFEALFALIMFIVFAACKKAFNKRLPIYLFSYSIFRFITDFFRGDDHGAVFGITALTPTQVAAIAVIIISGAALFTRPLLRLFKGEQLLDDLKKKIFKKEYLPLPYDYVPPVGKRNPATIVIAFVLAVALVISAVFYINPLNMSWMDDIRYDLEDIFSFLYQNKSTEDEIGETNGISVLDISDKGVIKDEKSAREVVESYDSWADFEFEECKAMTLDSGEHIYTFSQTIDGKPVLGKTRTVVTDSDHKALYMLGDAASLTYTQEVLEQYVTDAPKMEDAFNANIKAIEQMECWYDTGNGVVDAYHAVLSDDGETPRFGCSRSKIR